MARLKNYYDNKLKNMKQTSKIKAMLAGKDIVPISKKSVNSILDGVYYFYHESAKSEEESCQFMNRVFNQFLCDEHVMRTHQLCLIILIPKSRHSLYVKEIEELNNFIYNLSTFASKLSINWGLKTNPLTQKMDINVLATESS